jgi:hypothetical protein
MEKLQRPFEALKCELANLPLIAVDLGYSSRKKSCGLAWTGKSSGINLEFGRAVDEICKQLSLLTNPVLVLEAALSTFHLPNGNPGIRGPFEEGRGWYWGSGAVSLIAAQRLLRQLAECPGLDSPILIAEAFLSNKPQRTGHGKDAMVILRRFWSTQPTSDLRDGLEPASDLIQGVPPIRVFKV